MRANKLPPKVLVTGGAGFAGHHIVEHLIKNTDWNIIVLDRLSYAGNLDRLAHLCSPRLSYVHHDFRAALTPYVLDKLRDVDYVIHNGAETHVDRSLKYPDEFIYSNVVGTMNLLEAARKLPKLDKFIYVSTDEVHGPAPDGVDFKEDAPICPSNPYSASKAGGEALAYAWYKSFGVPVIITRTMNLFGERQHPEKFVPMCIKKVLNGETVKIHGALKDGNWVIGSRKWLHARNQADGLLFLLRNVPGNGGIYHIAGEEHTNLEILEYICDFMGRSPKYNIVDYHSSRPGHDLRYSLDGSKIHGLGWAMPIPFEKSLQLTVKWTVNHPEWLAYEEGNW